MKFIVKATHSCKPDYLTKSYPCLYDYDHEVEKTPLDPRYVNTYIRLDTLAELIEFQNKLDMPIILYDSYSEEDMYEIEIYDDWRE